METFNNISDSQLKKVKCAKETTIIMDNIQLSVIAQIIIAKMSPFTSLHGRQCAPRKQPRIVGQRAGE